jgi:CHASE3 domain sensor protein
MQTTSKDSKIRRGTSLLFSSVLTLAILLILVTLSTPIEYENAHGDADIDDDYIDLDAMSDEELEDICKSRGFELVRELNTTTGEPILYTHQDYVDAASECLQIEADLEEILTNHPEILEDVKRESERMMHQRDILQEKLDQMEVGMGEVEKEPVSAGKRGQETDSVSEEILESIQNERAGSTVVNSTTRLEEIVSNTTPALKPKSIYDPKEITREVIQQIKSDATSVLNIIAPKHLRDQVRPALTTFVTVAKDMGLSIYDLMRRYLTAFWGKTDDIRNRTSNDANAGSPASPGEGV